MHAKSTKFHLILNRKKERKVIIQTKKHDFTPIRYRKMTIKGEEGPRPGIPLLMRPASINE